MKEVRIRLFTAAVIILLGLLIQWFLSLAAHAAGADCCAQENLLRLDIRGNSNSWRDRSTELAVRSALIKSIRGLLKAKKLPSKIDGNFCKILPRYKKYFGETVEKVLQEKKAHYKYTLTVSPENPGIKKRGSTPAGRCPVIRVRLGRAGADKKWMVVFPPLCYLTGGDCLISPGQGENAEFRCFLVEVFKPK